MLNTFLMVLAAVGLVLLNAMFVAAEFAFVRVRSTRLLLLSQSGSKVAKAALFGQRHLEDYLSVCQLGITLASLGLGWLGEPAVARLLRPLLEYIGVSNPTIIHSLSVITGFILITFAHVTFGELAPKNISIRAAESTALFLAWPMLITYHVFRPFVTLLNLSAQVIMVIIGASNWRKSPAYSTEELKLLIAESKDDGQLDEVEERLLNNVMNMDRRLARDIMVHRTKVVTLSVDSSLERAVETILIHGHTRLPVYDGERDNVTGFIHAKDLLSHKSPNLRSIVRPAMYIYENMPTDSLLEQMLKKNTKMGLVWDEYGAWQGLLTLEDILEAIVGEIRDEFDREEPPITKSPEGWLLCETTVSLDELG
ncbi:MAG: hemolysin family protein, partial [Deltaproteobacteria bacterium]|nr:hemolysin family protein [Deltaproteobacteria bacterium]